MPVRKTASTPPRSKPKEDADGGLLPPAPGSGPSRRSARQANAKWNVEYADTRANPVEQESGSQSSHDNAKTGAKRSAPAGSPGSAKRVKFEDNTVGEVKNEIASSTTGLPSPEVTDEDSELSDVKSEPEDESSEEEVKDEDTDDEPKKRSVKRKAKASTKKSSSESPSIPKTKTKARSDALPKDKAATLQAKKLKSYSQFSNKSPFPDFIHPTPDEARLAHRILAKLHGERVRPEKVVARSDQAGCGDSPSVLDALVRTILSQNTSDKNSTRAKLSMDKVYGGSDKWDAILEGGQAKLQDAIKSGGLSVVKSKVIISILEQTKEKYGTYSLDHLFKKSDEDAMQELLAFQGVGPKTASCVLLFCLQRESFAVDTHVYRIAGMLGWRPQGASRDETHAHLEVRIPDEEKYGLHILLVGHGKKCDECKAGGKSVGRCELRKAFRKGKLEGEAGEDLKEEEQDIIKKEDSVEDKSGIKEEDLESGQEDYLHGMQSGKSSIGKKNLKKT